MGTRHSLVNINGWGSQNIVLISVIIQHHLFPQTFSFQISFPYLVDILNKGISCVLTWAVFKEEGRV